MSDAVDTLTQDEPETDVEQTSEQEVSASPAPAADAASVTPDAQGEPPAKEAAPANPQGDGSLTPPLNQTPEPQVDWKKRYSSLMSETDRKINAWKSQMEQQSSQMTELQKWKAEQEQRAQAASLKPWSKAHPENPKFNGLLERAKTVEGQLRRINPALPPEQQEAIRETIMGALTPQEQQQIQEYRDSLQTFQRDFFTDPQGTVMPMVQQLVQAEFQQMQQRQQAQMEVSRDFQDPQLAPMVKEYGEDFSKALNDGVPYDYAKHMMVMYAELQAAKNQLKGLSGKAAQADEQRRLAKGEASITRDPRSAPQDPYELAKAEAKRKGVSTDGPQFAAILARHSK